MADFTSVLNTPVEEVKRPPVVPFGTYVAMIDKAVKTREFTSNKDGRKWISCEFPTKLLQPRQDVDAQKMAEFGPLTSARPLDISFLAEDTEEGKKQLAWNLRQFFLNTLGLDAGPQGNSKTNGQLAAEAVGKQLLVTVRWEQFQEKGSGETATSARIQSTAKLG